MFYHSMICIGTDDVGIKINLKVSGDSFPRHVHLFYSKPNSYPELLLYLQTTKQKGPCCTNLLKKHWTFFPDLLRKPTLFFAGHPWKRVADPKVGLKQPVTFGDDHRLPWLHKKWVGFGDIEIKRFGGFIAFYPIGSMGLVYLPTFGWFLWDQCR